MQKKKRKKKKESRQTFYSIMLATKLIEHGTLWINPSQCRLQLTKPCLKSTFPSEDLHSAFNAHDKHYKIV